MRAGAKPTCGQGIHALPVEPAALTAPPERAIPALGNSRPEGVKRPAVIRHAVVRDVTSQHRRQPPTLDRDRVLTASTQLCADLRELGRQALTHRVPEQGELPLPREAAD